MYDRWQQRVIYKVLDLSRFTTRKGDSYKERIRKYRARRQAIKTAKQKLSKRLQYLSRRYRGRLLSRVPQKHRWLVRHIRRVGSAWRAGRRISVMPGLKDRFKHALDRYDRWRPFVRKALVRRNLSTDLVAIAFVESMFNAKAHSRSGAYGIWQFLHSTGKRFLHINKLVDERRDPIIATDAAARLLIQNFNSVKTWPLAITAYNYGRAGTLRALRKSRTRTLAGLLRKYRGRRFGYATKNYYAEFLAARQVLRNRRTYFPMKPVGASSRFRTFALPASVRMGDLIRTTGLSRWTLKRLNPALSRDAWESRIGLPKGYPLRISGRTLQRVRSRFTAIPNRRHHGKGQVRIYRVRRGDYLLRIARRYRTTLKELRRLNNLTRTVLRPGQRLRIPRRPSSPSFSRILLHSRPRRRFRG